MSVSYTHLDVYKRQDKDVLKMVGDIDALPSDTNKIINGLSWIYRGDNLFSNGSCYIHC